MSLNRSDSIDLTRRAANCSASGGGSSNDDLTGDKLQLMQEKFYTNHERSRTPQLGSIGEGRLAAVPETMITQSQQQQRPNITTASAHELINTNTKSTGRGEQSFQPESHSITSSPDLVHPMPVYTASSLQSSGEHLDYNHSGVDLELGSQLHTANFTTETAPQNLARTIDELTGLFAGDCDQQHASITSATNCNSTNGQLFLMNIPTEELNFSDIKDVWLVKSWQEILLRVSFVAPIVLLGLIGNLTIIYSMCRFKPIRSKPTNIFILNMALADLLTSIVCPNAALLTDIYQFYVLGSFICRFEGFIKITCLLVSAYSLIVLSCDWFLCVVKPCRTRITIKQSWLTLVSIWLVSVSMALPLLYWRNLRERHWKDLVEIWCCEHIQYTKYYWVGMTLFLIYLPTFIMTIVLIIILLQMDKFEAKLKRTQRNTSTTINNDLSYIAATSSGTSISSIGNVPNGRVSNNNSPNNSLSVSMKYRRRIVKILFFYLLTSIVCWTPLQFVIVYRHFRTQAVPANWFFELAFYSQLCASLSAAMNPIIFGFLSQPFRRVVTKSWMFRFLDKVWATNARAGRSDNNGKNDQIAMDSRKGANRDKRQTLKVGSNLNYARSSQRTSRDIEQPKLTIDYIEHEPQPQTSGRVPGSVSSSRRISILSTNLEAGHRHRHHHKQQQSHHHHHQTRKQSNADEVSQLRTHRERSDHLTRLRTHQSNSDMRRQPDRMEVGDQCGASNNRVSFTKSNGSIEILPDADAANGTIARTGRDNEAYVGDDDEINQQVESSPANKSEVR